MIDAEVFAFLHSCDLESRQGPLDYYENVEYNSTYHQSKFESNPFVNIRTYANIKVFWLSLQKLKLFPLFH